MVKNIKNHLVFEGETIMADIENHLVFEEETIMADIENHLEMLKRKGIKFKNIFLNGKEHNNLNKYLDAEKSDTLNIFIGNEAFEMIIQKEAFIEAIFKKYGKYRGFNKDNGYFDGFETSNGDQLFLLAREDQKKQDLKGKDLRDSIRLTLAHEFMHVKQWYNSLLPLKKTTKWKFNILKIKTEVLANILYLMNFKELAANIYAIKYAVKQHFNFYRLFKKILYFIAFYIIPVVLTVLGIISISGIVLFIVVFIVVAIALDKLGFFIT